MAYQCLIYVASFILLRLGTIFFYEDISVIPLLGPVNELHNMIREPPVLMQTTTIVADVIASITATETITRTASLTTLVTASTTTTKTESTLAIPTIDFKSEGIVEGVNSQVGCSWLLTGALKKRRAEYNLVLDAELAKLAKAISEAHESSREMREAGVFWPGKAELMIGLDQVLGHIVIEPLQSFCEAIYELLRDIPQEITSESDAAEARRLLVRTLWKLSQGGLVGGSTDGAKIDGYEVSLGAERAFKWVLEDLDDTYCLGFDCFWPSRVFNMWQHTEDIRAALKRRLSEVKALVPPSQKRSLASILNEIVFLLPTYVINIIAGNLLARRL